MKGVFFKNTNTFAVFCIIAGAILIILFPIRFFLNTEKPLSADDLIFAIFAVCLGLIALASGVLLMLFNRGAYLTVTEDHISAKYNWNKKIMVYFNEIDFVGSQHFALNIRAKNGKQYVIAGLINADLICGIIRKKMPLEIDKNVTKEALLSEIDLLRAKRKKEIIGLISSIIIMILNVFLCAFLTGWKDFSVFTKIDWLIFILFLVAELLIIIVTFIVAKKSGEKLNILNEKSVFLRKLILLTTPFLPGNLISSYMDSKYETRTTIFGFPNSGELYFCVEEIDWKYDLVCSYRSTIYSDSEDFNEDLSVEDLIQIK